MADVRISVANLATRLVEMRTGQTHFFGIRPKERVQALGGAAQLTLGGVDLLKAWYDARNFEEDRQTKSIDARFVVDEKCVEDVLAGFERIARVPPDFHLEKDPNMDILQELFGKEDSGSGPIITGEDAADLSFLLHDVVKHPPPKSGRGTSARERVDIPTRRLFRRYDLVASQALVRKILSHPVVHELTADELATTEGGTRRGRAASGLEIADNLFL